MQRQRQYWWLGGSLWARDKDDGKRNMTIVFQCQLCLCSFYHALEYKSIHKSLEHELY